MSDDLVKWRELESEFQKLFPRTLEDVYNSSKTAAVKYAGTTFEIRPVKTEVYSAFYTDSGRMNLSFVNGFEVWGPAHINQFPDPFYALHLPL